MSKILVVYCSRHGTTEKCTELISENLTSSSDIVNLGKEKSIEITPYETILIGGSIHAGSLQKQISKFIEYHLDELLSRKIGLFLCCMKEPAEAEQQFISVYPETLRNHASASAIFGGEFLLEKMSFIEKWIVKKIAGVTKTVSKINENEIVRFVRNF